MVGMDGLGPAPARHLLRIGAGELVPSTIVPDRTAVLVGEPHQMRHEIRHRAELKLRVAFGHRREGQGGVLFGHVVQTVHLRFRSARSEEHTSELQSLMRISYAVFCLKKNKNKRQRSNTTTTISQT